jgi:hypothetical protein
MAAVREMQGALAAALVAPLPPSAPAPVDLSKLNANIPGAKPDTFTFRPLRVERLPDAGVADGR